MEHAENAESACPACRAPTRLDAKFCWNCGTPLAVEPSRLRTARTELRQITVAFCDLVGSSALSADLDPEDLTALIAQYHGCVADVTARNGGFLARFMGDGSLSFFGYPRAGEDDAERAVRAGLEMVDAVAKVRTQGRSLQARVGIAAGVSVVGDVVGTGDARGFDIAGEAPNLAARMQALAEPNTVLIDRSVFQLVREKFECNHLGAHAIRGWREPVPVWRVLRRAEAVDRFALSAAESTTPVLGREREFDGLRGLWRDAVAGKGGVALLLGEPGIGKSRLVQTFARALSSEDHLRIAYFGQHHQEGVPLHPYVQQLGHTAGFAANDTAETRLRKLRASFGHIPPEHFRLIAELVVPPDAMDDAPLQMAPQRRREQTLRAIWALLERQLAEKPVLIVVEDAHWIDPTSHEILALAVRRAVDRRLLVLVTGRPQVAPDWTDLPHVRVMRLGALEREQSTGLVQAIAGTTALPADIVSQIVARCDGVPLYLEEVTRAVLESSRPGRAEGGLRTSRGAVVPASIHASLLSRIDAVGPARELAEVAAVIGREFSIDVLRSASDRMGAELDAMFARLLAAGLIVPRAGHAGEYRFKHALIQDAAYGTIVRERRRALHGRIAHALESRFPELAAGNPTVVAHHCVEAGLSASAVGWWLRAAGQSLERSSAVEAAAQLARALAVLADMPEDDWRNRTELELRVLQGKASIFARGNGAHETGEAFARARALCDRLDDPPELLTVLFGQFTYALLQASLAEARERAEEVLRLGEHRDDDIWPLIGCYAAGLTANLAGDLHLAQRMLRDGIALYDESRRERYAAPVLGDPRVFMRTFLAHTLLCCGDLDGAEQACEQALAQSRGIGHALAIAQSLFHYAFCMLQTGSPPAAITYLDELDAIAREHGFLFYDALSRLTRGWCASEAGDPEAGLRHTARGFELYRMTNSVLYVSSFKRLEGEMRGRLGDFRRGLQLVDEAARMMAAQGSFWDHAELLRTQGELLLGCGEHAQAEACLRSAMGVADRQGARLFKLRAAVALARLYGGQRRTDDKRLVLRSVREEFGLPGRIGALAAACLAAEAS